MEKGIGYEFYKHTHTHTQTHTHTHTHTHTVDVTYIIVNDRMNFTAAKQYCEEKYGRLAIVKHDAELTALKVTFLLTIYYYVYSSIIPTSFIDFDV